MTRFNKVWSLLLFTLVSVPAQATTIVHTDGTMEEVSEMSCTSDGRFSYTTMSGQTILLKKGDVCVGMDCLAFSFEADQKCQQDAPKPHFNQSISKSLKKGFAIFGSNTIGDALMPALLSANAKAEGLIAEKLDVDAHLDTFFHLQNPEGDERVSVDIIARGSGTAFPALMEGGAEIGMASRPIKTSEIKILEENGIINMREAGQEHVLALDGLVVIVSPKNTIKQLTLAQVASIFAGDITNWSQVGGADKPIHVYARDAQSGTFDTFTGLVLKPNGKKLTSSAKTFESNQKLSDSVFSDENGIGFTGFAFIGKTKALALESECGIVSSPTETLAINVRI